MKKYGVNELRKMYLEFFESKGHLAMKSFSLVPHNDNSLLLINAGMAPLKPYFTGQEIPPRKRVTTCQKCIRTGDIENVGKTDRHGTFFEMLGNFSFGDYFKHEAIAWSWEFLTEVVGLDADRLYPSVYLEDDEAFAIWRDEVGIAPERIFKFGKEDNFWEHGAGPCGPCSEIYYDRGEKYGCGSPDCKVGCECDRFMEVWNNVFTQFNGDGHGNYEELENKNIDTGMGLERLATVMQDVDSIFDVDTIKAIRDKICEFAGVSYGEEYKTDVSIRVITDHIRSVTFMVSDGITPSNEGRGYVLRRLLRRAARHGRLLGIQGEFLAKLSETVMAESHTGYPELLDRKDYIIKLITVEEQNFNKTIDQGLAILNTMMEDLQKSGEKVLSGENTFKLYDTYGFPIDLTIEILEEKGFSVDFDELKGINPDTVGWIRFYPEPSIINYPIVQTTDNEKYLHKTFSENDNTLGTIFLNADNNANFNDRNSIIYGHRMKDGSMFRKLDEYKDKFFWEANPYFYIYTPDGREIVYHIYSAATVKDTDDVYLTGFENDEAYQSYLDMTKRIAIYDTGVEVTTADSVVTLSTCTSASDEHRFVVIGVKEQENQMGQTK